MSSTSSSSRPHPKLVYGKDDALFGAIERQQGERPFGNVLDAGTGVHSLRWIATLKEKGMTNWTAITADATMKRSVEAEAVQLGLLQCSSTSSSSSSSSVDNCSHHHNHSNTNVVMGNWFSETSPLTLNQTYDTILADYLIGAMDGFSPYQQDLMIPKLVQLLNPGGRLYIVGLQPIPDKVDNHEDPGASVICRVRQVRDACILLAGHRCYREYPVSWIHRQFSQLDNQMQLMETSKFPILYRHSTIVRQINVARSKFPYFPTPELVASLKAVLDQLERESLEVTERSPTGIITLGFDYVISAEKRSWNGPGEL